MGSEMCIRDSFSSKYRYLLRRRSAAASLSKRRRCLRGATNNSLKCARQLRSHPRRVGAVQPALPPERRAARGQPRVVHEQRRRRRRTAAQGRDRRVCRAIPARRLHAVRPDARPSRLADGVRRAVGPLCALPVDAVRLRHAAAGGARRDDRTERRERAKEWPLGRPSGRSGRGRCFRIV